MHSSLLFGRIARYSLVGLILLAVHIPQIRAQEESSSTDEVLAFKPVMRFAHLNSDDGLVQNTVEAILQDSNGFMWFGTQGGLSRYDGYRFTTFQHDPNNANSLSHNFVRDLYEDRDGMIWIATEGGGINRLDPDTLEFTHYGAPSPNTPIWAGISGDRHFSVFQDSRGHIWAGGTRVFGVSDYDPVSEIATVFRMGSETSGLMGNSTHDFVETSDRQLWLATESAIVRHDPTTGQFTAYDMAEFNDRRVISLLEDGDGQLWAGGSQGIYRFNAQTDAFEQLPEPRGITDMIQDATGLFWLASTSGLYHFDPASEQILGHEESMPGLVDSLNNDQISAVYQDRAGMIWIGGPNGLDIYDPLTARFEYYRHAVPGAQSSLAAGQIQAIHIADSTAWIGVDSTLHRIDLTRDAVTVYRLEDYDLGTQQISAIVQDHTGMVWIGGNRGRLLQFDPDTEVFTEYEGIRGAPQEQPSGTPTRQNAIVALYEDASLNLWVVRNERGIFRIDESREVVDQFDSPTLRGPGESGTPIQPPVMGLNVDRAGNLWLTNLNGFYRFDPSSESYTRFRLLNPDGSDTFTEASVEDDNGIIWVASRDGLFRLDPETGSVVSYTMADGLPTNFLVGILQDEAGNLWISTKRGLSQFSPSTQTFRNFDVHDGLQGNEFSSRIFAQAQDGRLFFGGTGGLTAFYPQRIVASSYQPPVILDDFELFSESVQPRPDSTLTQPIWSTDSLTLTHDQNYLTFEFAVLNYAFDDTNHYRYRLDGFENVWHDADSTRRFATYTNLSAGTYTFRVQAANKDGVWSENEVALTVVMLPPWWETTWARILAAIALSATVLAGYQWRVHRIASRNRALQQAVSEKTLSLEARTRELQVSEVQLRQAKEAAEAASRAKSAFLANMSHELRSPLNAILGFTQLAHRNKALSNDIRDNLGVVLRSGEHLLALINQVLDLSKIEAGRMTLNETDFDLYRLMAELEDMFTLVADNKGLKLQFKREEDVPRYVATDETKLRQTLINLISNALKFTSEGHISVRVRMMRTAGDSDSGSIRLAFEVEDTGLGIPKHELAVLFDAFVQASTGHNAKEGTGLGLAISRSFVNLMGGDIRVESEVGRGSTFTFDITCHLATRVEPTPALFNKQVAAIAPGQPTYRIMVVDDKEVNRQFIVRLLQPLGFELLEAEDGAEAVDFAKSFSPHLIWMDIRMPVMDGIEATRQLRADAIGKSIKIIALTASVYDEDSDGASLRDFDELVRKPIHADTIFEIMQRHLGVAYVYAPMPLTEDTDDMPQLSPSEIHEALASIPADLIARLSTGTALGDMPVIDATISTISRYNVALATSLSRLAQRFQFDALLALLQEIEKP